MGTNFYWLTDPPPHQSRTIKIANGEEFDERSSIDRMDPRIHIGKRSFAGLYCWDCRVTLCTAGEQGLGFGHPFHEACPKCGATPVPEDDPSRGRERSGVQGACVFTWAQSPTEVALACEARKDDIVIEDEYGDKYTGRSFLEELTICPIYCLSIGEYFS